VKIKNRGSSAYKPELYGASIIVERLFSRVGSPGFKLKDENGRIVSTKKSELEDIIDAFALQLDNPMNVLTQDNARQFLNDSNAKDKYKFFLKGTQLEGLRGEYELLRFNTDSQQNKAETLIADIEALRKQMEVAVKKARQASTVDGMKKRERLLANQIAWARVEDEERVRFVCCYPYSVLKFCRYFVGRRAKSKMSQKQSTRGPTRPMLMRNGTTLLIRLMPKQFSIS
jgi:hypothetical protein